MSHARAGQLAQPQDLIDLNALLAAYQQGDPQALKPVSFGTSGHRGSAFKQSFNDTHIAAIVQAIVDYRRVKGIMGPLFLGKDTHALSAPAQQTALEVLAANSIETHYQEADGFTPTPVISRAIIRYNAAGHRTLADGILITPSHNPPEDGGIKYNPPGGGPADTDVTCWIETRANALMAPGNIDVKRCRPEELAAHRCIRATDFAEDYIKELGAVIDMAAIAKAGLNIGVDTMGGAAVAYWPRIADMYGLKLKVVNTAVDPAFAFMALDHDGKIRMDCSSPPAMARLVGLKDQYDIAWGNDADVDRHGIVVPGSGLMNPNHYLAVAIDYLLNHRPDWKASSRIGKTLVSSNLIDLVTAAHGREVYEVPVGFKWFADGLSTGELCFGGEESAGASFLQRNGKVWTTDKDGIILGLLAAEITALTGQHPGQHYQRLTQSHGTPCYRRIDSPMDVSGGCKLIQGGCGVFLGLIYVVKPKLSLYSIGLCKVPRQRASWRASNGCWYKSPRTKTSCTACMPRKWSALAKAKRVSRMSSASRSRLPRPTRKVWSSAYAACPAIPTSLLQDKQFTPDVTRILRNMKAARQVEAVELMIASNTITVAHAEALLKATPPEQRADVKPAEREKKTAPIEQIEKLEKEMSQVQEKYQEAESSYGSDLLNLVVAKGYLTKLLANGAVKSYIGRHEPEILTHLELVVNTVSMEEAVQQQGQEQPTEAAC